MRNLIRNWLKLPEYVPPPEPEPPSLNAIKELVEAAVRQVLEPGMSSAQVQHRRRIYSRYGTRDLEMFTDEADADISGIVRRHIDAVVKTLACEHIRFVEGEVRTAVADAIEKGLEPESFIDGVVVRLRAKQL